MLRNIILLPVLFLCIKGVFSQKGLSSKLLDLEKEIFYAPSDSIKNKYIIEKSEIYFAEKIYSDELLNEIKRINFKLIKDQKQKARLLWNATLVSYINKDIYYSLHYLDEYETCSNDSSTTKSILKLLIYANYDPNVTRSEINKLSVLDSSVTCFECLIDVQEYELKHKRFKEGVAYFIPGMGMLLNGNILKGSISVGLNTLTGVAIFWLIKHNLYINAIAWGTNLVFKFYVGNINLTKKLVDEKEMRKRKKLADDCELLVRDILTKYPLYFK